MIELQTVSAGYGRQTVLKNVSARFEKGTLTSVIGINGCGKSTLLKTILGIVPAKSGCISLDDRPLGEMNRNQIARQIAYLSQGRSAPDMTVEQLVLHGRFPYLQYPRQYSREDRRIARAAMEKIGIEEYGDRPMHTLSGGMRQAVYIAMALTQDTDNILLDEPTTYLDVGHQLAVMRLLRSLADSGKSVITVTHDLPAAFAFSHRILLLEDGQVAEADTPRRICEGDTLHRIFGVSLVYSPQEKTYNYRYDI